MVQSAKKRRKRSNRGDVRQRRSQPESVSEERPQVIVVGHDANARALCTAIRRGGMSAQHQANPKLALELVHDDTMACILAPPLRGLSVAHFCRRAPDDLLVLVALAGLLDAKAMRKLYDDGVTAVFSWPKEKRALVQTLIRLIDIQPAAVDRYRVSSDVALEEQAKLALEADSAAFEPNVHVVVVHGVATLIGKVDALWKVYAAEQIVEELAGIQDVNVSGIAVVGPRRTDRAITKAVRQVMGHTSDVDASTVAVAVEDGCVTLSGSAESRRELHRLEQLVRHIRGVRAVDRYVVVSEKAKRQDRAVAKRVNSLLSSRGVNGKVAGAVFGGVCVLSGRVESAKQRRTLEELSLHQPGVERVVNKLVVAIRR